MKHTLARAFSLTSTVLAMGSLCPDSFGLQDRFHGSPQEWQAKAVMQFPELGVPNSPFNKLFLKKAALLKEKSPQTLLDPSWPYRLAVRIAEHPEMLRDLEGDEPPRGTGESGGDSVEVVADLCAKTIKQRVSAEYSTEKLEQWIAGDKVIKERRVQALTYADAATPELRSALAGWVKKMLRSPGHNSVEDTLWLEAFLSADTLREPVAALLGMDLEEFEFRVLGETESMEFAKAWLSGRQTPFFSGCKGLTPGKVRVLEMVAGNRFQLGGLAVTENFCLETFYEYELLNPGKGFLLLDQFSLVHWPESILTGTKPPPNKFNLQKKEWVNYLNQLKEIHSGQGAPQKTAQEASGTEEVHPGALERYVLWKSRRMESPEEAVAWMESVSAQFGRHPSAEVRDLRRVFPALAYVVRLEAQSTP